MSTNLSKQKREDLLNKIEEIRKYLKSNLFNENARKLTGYLGELTAQINGQKYGLVFEEHKEAIDEKLENNLPVLTEEKELFVGNGGEMNFLIEGDNLASLQLLEKTHKGKIDVIYIDPPYNTGKKDFKYDDDYIDVNDTFRHSKWLSFMTKRLEIAKDLLSADGFIVISIDDYECSQLKTLCDGIFGENQFVNMFVWQRNSSGKTEKDKYTVNTEYVLLYSKTDKYELNNVYKPLAESTKSMYKKDDNDGRGKYRLYPLQKPSSPGPETTYDYIDNNGKVWKCPPKGWRMKYEKLKALENDNRLCLDNNTLSEKAYWNERASEGKRIDTLWNDISENTVGSKELETVLGRQGLFNNPKPTELIERCLQIKKDNFTILDFFAGSGTTGHAVLKLNAEDGGHRKFILCTNNENGICRDITYERLKTVITGERKDGSKYSDGLSGSLKYFKVDFVEITEKEYYEYADKLLLHVRELVELENAVDFEHDTAVAIVLTEEELAEFMQSLASTPLSNQVETEVSERSRTVYLGHDVLLSKAQKELLKQKEISVKIIPQYYYPELNG